MNFYRICRAVLMLVIIASLFPACRYDKGTPDYNDYPADVGKIIITKCATKGCHNDVSKGAAAGLSLQSWDKLFEGGNTSACVIPYRAEYSTFFYYINTYPDLGTGLLPIMPYNENPLSKEEVTLLKNWINAGAPDGSGFVKFSDNSLRKKFYVLNQGCDITTVFDTQTLLPMRYVEVGSSVATEAPSCIKFSPDGQFWYVVSNLGKTLQKYRSSDDALVSSATLGFSIWTNFTISPDGQTAYVSGFTSSGEIAEVDLQTMAVTHHKGFSYPRGLALNNLGDTLYVAQKAAGNNIYKVPVTNFSAKTILNNVPSSGVLSPYQIVFSNDGSRYYVTCQGTSDLRIFDASNDSLIAVVPLGANPSEMSISQKYNYLFVSCQDDTLSTPGYRGSVAVVDLNNNSLIKTIYTGHQPAGLAVADVAGLVYVANRNVAQDGPKPHHSFGVSGCNGRNGYVTFIDIKSLSVPLTGNASKKVEVAVDPYSIALRP